MISGGFRTPMRRHSRASPLADPGPDDRAQPPALQPPALPPELEARVAVLESAAPAGDFDLTSWLWMILVGIAIPALLLLIGWLA